jgi:uncharacterized protein YfaS (alpha-2-macroglobulin family)
MNRKTASLLLILLSFVLSSFAEEQLAVHVNEMRVPQMMGVVQNRHGDPVPNVRVEVIHRENGHVMGDAKTDDQGRFAYPNLKDGKYNVKVHHNGISELYHVHVTSEKAEPELVLKYK